MTELTDYTFQHDNMPPKKIIILLHGYGADGKDLISLAPILGATLPHTFFFAPNAPQPCEMAPMGRQWFSLLDRSDDIMAAQAQSVSPVLAAYIEEKCHIHNLQMKDVGVIGFSQGTMMALYTMPRMAKACAGVVAFSGRLLDADKLQQAAKSSFPVCAIHGTADDVVPFESLSHMENGMKTAGFNIETYQRPGLGHGIDEKGLEIAGAFLNRCLQ